jgi:predicted enzyme related to lactoylglutathione lyase
MENGMHFQRRQLLRILSLAVGSNFALNRNRLGIATQQAAQSTTSTPSAMSADKHGIAGETEMEKVTGIGGLFFRAKDPKSLVRWYQQHLGVGLAPSGNEGSVWQQEAGPTSFSPFPETSNYFGDPQKFWMVNFRVRDLGKMAAQLQAAGIAVKVDPQSYPYGRFARLHDPEGNPIELWQPAKTDAPH